MSSRTSPPQSSRNRRRSAASTASAGTSRVLEPRSWRAPVISTISVAAEMSAAAGRSSSMRAERVGGAVGEHRRRGDPGQVLGARPLGLAGRMQRIREQCQHIDCRRLVGDHHRRHPAAVGVAARDDRAVGQRAGQLDGLDDAGLVGRGGSRTAAPSAVAADTAGCTAPRASRGAAHSSQILCSSGDSRLPPAPWVSTTTPCGPCPVGLVGDARDLLEVHSPSLNSADTGPWPCPNGYAARRHSVTQRFPNATASGTV